MGIDSGFDVYPPLEPTAANQRKYELFLDAVIAAYDPRNCGADRSGGSNDNNVLRVNDNSESGYIEFMVGEHPHMPRRCEHFLRFSSKISGRSEAWSHILAVTKIAKQWLGDRVYFWDESNDFAEPIRRHGCYSWTEIYATEKGIGYEKLLLAEPEGGPVKDVPSQERDGPERVVNEADGPTGGSKLYDIRPIPGRGQGLVANSSIPEGSRILQEVPLFTMSGTTRDASHAERIVKRKVKNLSKDQRESFLALQNSMGTMHDPLLGIAKTNLLPVGDDDDIGGLFLEASRINHSCHPNAQHVWNSGLRCLTLHAIRDIDAGSEITISYFSGISPGYAERQQHLREDFSFTCTCELCSLRTPARHKSDRRLAQIRSISEGDVGNATKDKTWILENPIEAFREARLLFHLLDKEDIRDFRRTRACVMAFDITAAAGDKARAKVFAEKAYAVRRLLSGDDNPVTGQFKRLAERPVEHPLFGLSQECYDDHWEAPSGMSEEEMEDWLWSTDSWLGYGS